MNMTKIVGLVVAGVALHGAALAADTSATINVRKSITPVGVTPVVSVLTATSTVTASTFTANLPAPTGTARIASVVCQARSAVGDTKGLRVSDSGGVLTVTSGVSDTLYAGDVVKCIVVSQ